MNGKYLRKFKIFLRHVYELIYRHHITDHTKWRLISSKEFSMVERLQKLASAWGNSIGRSGLQ